MPKGHKRHSRFRTDLIIEENENSAKDKDKDEVKKSTDYKKIIEKYKLRLSRMSEQKSINQFNIDQKKEEDIIKQKIKKLELLKEKEEKREKEKQEKLNNIAIKQEDDYLKQYEKKQNINKIERINQYKNEKRNEEILKKEKKLEEFKKKKIELIQSKSKQADKFEKEKEKLIVDFEKNFRNKEHFDTNKLIKNLFPTKDLSENDTKLKIKISKLIEDMQKTDPKNLKDESINKSGVNETSNEN